MTKEILCPVYRLSIAQQQTDSGSAVDRDGPSARLPLADHHLVPQRGANRPVVIVKSRKKVGKSEPVVFRCDDLAVLPLADGEAREDPANPLPQQRRSEMFGAWP